MKAKGQATVEFIFSFGFLLFFFLFFITVCINIGVGYLVHYAVFKTSRFYLTYDDGSERLNVITQAQNQAVNIFNQFDVKAFGITGELSFNHPDQTNVLYEYVGAVFLYSPPLKKIGPFALPGNFQYMSESFLGKEPSRDECRCRIQEAMGKSCEGALSAEFDATLFDNGC